ncbi:MAG TPA: hypothetical protein VJ112_01230, partial [Rhabdochlamydiaceae bacterium]|nr:hypothetical protein [Rhabdochlamydiaceae bacterium]
LAAYDKEVGKFSVDCLGDNFSRPLKIPLHGNPVFVSAGFCLFDNPRPVPTAVLHKDGIAVSKEPLILESRKGKKMVLKIIVGNKEDPSGNQGPALLKEMGIFQLVGFHCGKRKKKERI